MGRTISEITRRAVAERAVFCCEYCRAQERYSPDDFVIDHILPRRRQGSNLLVNLALACFTGAITSPGRATLSRLSALHQRAVPQLYVCI
ncbi:HNH endonuclease [Armatimonas sp.]|uniref:HNH endonuclease n=1 Tax=Armatimonas sp. TaxID=1872638 RepID=UPI00374DB573